jgi:hypothetical protein
VAGVFTCPIGATRPKPARNHRYPNFQEIIEEVRKEGNDEA